MIRIGPGAFEPGMKYAESVVVHEIVHAYEIAYIFTETTEEGGTTGPPYLSPGGKFDIAWSEFWAEYYQLLFLYRKEGQRATSRGTAHPRRG
jgi:hypothetical protein